MSDTAQPPSSDRDALVARLIRLPAGHLVAWAGARPRLLDLHARLQEAANNPSRQIQIAVDWMKWEDYAALLADLEVFDAQAPTPAATPTPAAEPTPAPLPLTARLADLLRDAFEPHELRILLLRLPWGAGVVADLSTNASRSMAATEAAQKIVDRGHAGPELFATLTAERSGRADEIRALAEAFAARPALVPPPIPLPVPSLAAEALPADPVLVASTLLHPAQGPRSSMARALAATLAVAGMALYAAVWGARPSVPPMDIGVTVIQRGAQPLGPLLTQLAALGAWGVVIEDPLTAATTGGDEAAIREGIAALNAAKIPVVATSAIADEQFIVCGVTPCLSSLIEPHPLLDAPDALGPRELSTFDACAHGKPTAPLALELLKRGDQGVDLPEDWGEDQCRTAVTALPPPQTRRDWPWCTVSAMKLFTEPPTDLCAGGHPVRGRVVLITPRDDEAPRFTVRGSHAGAMNRGDVIATLAWSLIQR